RGAGRARGGSGARRRALQARRHGGAVSARGRLARLRDEPTHVGVKARDAAADRPVVVLLHGLARTPWSVQGMPRHPGRAGLATWSRSYPSRRLPIDQLADWIAEHARRDLGEREVLAVTHSLGGIVLRYLARRLRVARAVLVAPPNQGSRVAQALRRRA